MDNGSTSRGSVLVVDDEPYFALFTPSTIGKTFDLVSGDTPIDEAVRAL